MDWSLKEKCLFLSIAYNPRGAAELEMLHATPLQLSGVRSLHSVRFAVYLSHLPLLSGFRNILLQLNTSEIKSHFWNFTSRGWTFLQNSSTAEISLIIYQKSLAFHSLLDFVRNLCKILVKCDTLHILLCVISKPEDLSNIFFFILFSYPYFIRACMHI